MSTVDLGQHPQVDDLPESELAQILESLKEMAAEARDPKQTRHVMTRETHEDENDTSVSTKTQNNDSSITDDPK